VTARPRVESSFALDIAWGNLAADLYRATYSTPYVLEELKNRRGVELPDGTVEEYLRRRRDVALRRPPPLPPYSHPDVYPRFTKTIHQRLLEMRRFKEETGESAAEAEDWLRDQLDRYRRVDHFHYTEDELFTTPEATAAFIRRVKKWHRAVGRPVSGEGFEDVLAGTWSDMGLGVFLSPRNYDGPDAHLEVRNQWVALSMKSEGRQKMSQRTIQISSLAPHDVEIENGEDCFLAVAHAIAHLDRYERMIYLRASEENFPEEPVGLAQRYTLLELPHDDIVARMRALSGADFTHFFADAESARERNTFTIPVNDDDGRRLFSVTVSRRPPRVSITSIDFDYCELISSYWTEVIDEHPRIPRIHEESGFYHQDQRPRWDV
jgi:hypothetical protein